MLVLSAANRSAPLGLSVKDEYPTPRAAPAHGPLGYALNKNPLCESLTARQLEVLAVMMQGKSNKAICRVLNLAEPTVKNHVTAILRALKVTNRTEAVLTITRHSVAPLSTISCVYTISGYSGFGGGGQNAKTAF